MKFLEEHRLVITTLTPVHIGCGEDYTPIDYVIDDNALFAFDSPAISEALSANARTRLRKLVKGNRQEDVLKQVQKLFYNEREALIAKANHYLPVASGVADLYQKRIGQTAQQESSGKKVFNRLEIERTFYNPVSQKPVIPGSSIKGAIRTALLDMENKDNACSRNEKNQELQRRLFKYEKFEQDPMRLVQLDDTQWVEKDVIHSEIRFAVNRPRQEPKQGQSKRTMAEDKGLYQLLETLPGLSLRTYSSRLTIQKVNQLCQSGKLPTTELRWTMEQIVQACNSFYRPLLQREMSVIRERRYASSEWEEHMRKLLVRTEPLLTSNKAMLLRLGRHSGAEAVTLNGVRRKIMQGRGNRGKYEPNPRTLWLATDVRNSRSEMTPFGWILVEIDPPDDPPDMLKDLTGETIDTRQQWLEKQRQRIAVLQGKLIRRKQQEETQEQERIAEQQAERERQERLLSMTEEQRAIYDLRASFEKAQADKTLVPQGPVPGRLWELMNKAVDWPSKDIIELCDLAEKIYKPLGMLRGKKGRERKARIEKLKGQ